MALARSRRLRWLWLLPLLCVAAYLLRGVWLPAIGWSLVRDDGPSKADAALVLAGDNYGNRILFAADLLRRGYVPVVLVSGPKLIYDEYESVFAIKFAVEHGCRPEWFAPLNHNATSTVEEARYLLPQLQERGVRSFLLVTSNYHTARSVRIFRDEAKRTGSTIAMRPVAAPDKYFDPDRWWKNRESRKTVFFEISKTIATALGQ